MLSGMSVPTKDLYKILDIFTQIFIYTEMYFERGYIFSLNSAVVLISLNTYDTYLGSISHLRHITFLVDTTSLNVRISVINIG
jgi:hypothetical protein